MKIIKRFIEKIGIVYLLVIIATLLGKILGLGREAVIAYKFGTSHNFDIYLVVSIIPTMIATLFLYALPHIVIPRFDKNLTGSKNVTFRVYSLNFFWSFTLMNFAVSFLYLILSPFICGLLFPSVSIMELDEAIAMSRIFSVYILFAIQFCILKTFYASNNEFILPEYVQLLTHISIISTVLILANHLKTFSLLIGLIIGSLLQVLVLFGNLHRRKILKYFKFGIKRYQGLGVSVLIIIIIELLGQTYSFIDRSFFDKLPNGFIGGLYYANIISNLPVAIFAMTLGSIVFPKLSEYIQNKKSLELRKLLLSVIIKLLSVALPTSLLLFFFSRLVVRILLERGAFDLNATEMTSQMLKFLVIGLPFVMIHTILAKIIFALKKEGWFLLISLAGVCLKYFLTYWFVRGNWFFGVALSTSLVFMATVIVLLVIVLYFLKYNTGSNLKSGLDLNEVQSFG